MFSNTEAFLILLLAREADELWRREHAAAVVRRLGLDPRLEAMVPLPPKQRRLRPDYERVIRALIQISRTDEPKRTRLIHELCERLARGCSEKRE